ncbi:MAG: hypothetical protein IK030_01700 [Bacteroidales bacterium]|nr:hypothetical protein [Bacteroidales bacterium]
MKLRTLILAAIALLPLLSCGNGAISAEVFWFAFAVGTIAGLVFSMLALVFVLPVYVK